MPVFVCSLFLPYTVNFHDLPTAAQRPSAPVRMGSRTETTLLGAQTPPPKTPAAGTDAEDFFSQVPPSALAHLARGSDPRSLVRSDSHIAEWGRALHLNQPPSRAEALPPSMILGYGSPPNGEEEQQAVPKKKPSKSGKGPRPTSHERRWATEWTIEPAEQGNGGLANAVRMTQQSGDIEETLWLGTVGFPTDSLESSTKEEIAEKLESEYNSIAVYISDNDLDGHYSHYCKTILWPVFHYQIPDHPKSKAYEDHSWVYYVNLNRAFADSIVKNYKRGDTIWIHDYHLLLVPAMVREKLPDAEIGFFLHAAFPSSEVFRCLAFRRKLLEGMLGANVVLFQNDEYKEHFLTTCSRLLNVEATLSGVQLDDHLVNVGSVPIGIDPEGLDQARQDPAVTEWVKVMEERYKGKKLIVARDKLDNIRGVRQKLLAFELFLNKYPEWRDKAVLIQVATFVSDNPQLSATVSDIVTRIDSQYSSLAHQPLVFLRQDIAFPQYLALLSVADALMITSLREGMNLTSHEFVICQDGKLGGKKHGPVILSEFTGSAAIFGRYHLSVNPWDYQQCANAIKTALEMGPEEKARRFEGLHDVVLHQTGKHWCEQLNARLRNAYEEHYRRDTMSIPRLSASQLSDKYRKSKERLFILDYEGTLTSLGAPASIHLASPQRVIDALNDLLSDEKNIVYIMSARMPEELDKLFDRVPGVGKIAENGCFVQEPFTKWKAFPDLAKMEEWKEPVKTILKYYRDRIEGSSIEERYCSLVFRYGKAEDAEGAARQAGDCANHINDACGSQNIRAVPLDKSVTIEPLQWSKGSAATHVFDRIKAKHGSGDVPDFLFVAGDDREDEAIFRWANGLAKSRKVQYVTTVTVGKRNTEAMATLTQGTSGLLSVLQRLSRIR
ncbi:hypothetical protein EJ06DRAFT_502758 [Trichodelitschia bisporula]|uniref:Uncharacterized protein n=1 Tax=Trichodelitschia bisporula TaxID=703511 RepID=A0A6G1IB24_9PEZI|nr:hypothetical protein EJ06DRAFT_502758 [Trichodelitschia bisporula]